MSPLRVTSKEKMSKTQLIYRFSHLLFEKRSESFRDNRLTRHSRSGKHGRLGHVSGTREVSRGRSLRSIHFIWF